MARQLYRNEYEHPRQETLDEPLADASFEFATSAGSSYHLTIEH